MLLRYFNDWKEGYIDMQKVTCIDIDWISFCVFPSKDGRINTFCDQRIKLKCTKNFFYTIIKI